MALRVIVTTVGRIASGSARVMIDNVDPDEFERWVSTRMVDWTDHRGLRRIFPFETIDELQAYPQPEPA